MHIGHDRWPRDFNFFNYNNTCNVLHDINCLCVQCVKMFKYAVLQHVAQKFKLG